MTENSQHESARLSAARCALAAANENPRAATARAQEVQTDYYRALNTVTRLEPQHKKLLQALGVAKDRFYVESYASLPDKVAQITRERLAQVDSINAEI